MHEFSICQSLVDALLVEVDKLEPTPKRLVTARVVVGDLRQIVPEFLRNAYEVLTKDTVAEGSKLEIRTLPIQARCAECKWEGTVKAPFFQCPSCESFQVETTGGMELYLEGMEVEQD